MINLDQYTRLIDSGDHERIKMYITDRSWVSSAQGINGIYVELGYQSADLGCQGCVNAMLEDMNREIISYENELA